MYKYKANTIDQAITKKPKKPSHLFNDGAEMVSEEFLSLQAGEHVHLGGYELLLCSIVSLLCLQEILNKHSLNNRAVNPGSLNPDPAFQVNLDPIRIQGFDVQKLKKKIQQEVFYIFI
jgi:hypothetical protein